MNRLWYCLMIVSVVAAAGCSSLFKHDIGSGPVPWTQKPFLNTSEEFHFAILADRTGGMRPGVFEKAVPKVNLLRPEFVICVGDLIEGMVDLPEEIEKERDELDSIVGQFDMPFFYVPGNHDITNPVMARLWEERYGRRYYWFIYKDVLFICLDSEERERSKYISSVQMEWLKRVLKEHRNVRWTFLFMHKPGWLYQEGYTRMFNGKVTPPEDNGFGEIREALRDRDYTMFAGHLHQYTKYVRDSRKCFILSVTGAGSSVSELQGVAEGGFDHTVWVTMTGKGPVVANIATDGIYDEDIVDEKRYDEMVRKNQLKSRLKLDLDEANTTDTRMVFTAALKNPYEGKTRYELKWVNTDGWKITPGQAEGVLLPGQTENFTFNAEAVARRSRLVPACRMTFYQEDRPESETADFTIDRLLLRLERPVSTAVFAAVKPVIDGRLDDAVWQKAQKISGFRNMYGGAASAPTDAWIAYDRNNLYIAFKCHEPEMSKILGTVKKHDGAVWHDDSIEIFLDTGKDRKNYYHCVINSLGVDYDAATLNGEYREWELNTERAVMRNPDSWTVEVAMPWKNLNMEAPGKDRMMGLLLCRFRRACGTDYQQYPVLYRQNHNPDLFGDLRFEEK